MTTEALYREIRRKGSFLCVGLDTDARQIPAHLLHCEEDPVFEFNRRIVDATAPYTVAYKPNLAFYETGGAAGWLSLNKTVEYIKAQYPDVLIIADAKRGDIGNTSDRYAQAFFEQMGVDAITLSPYMGRDTVQSFLAYPGKWAVLLALTSNPSAADFELLKLENGERLYERVLKAGAAWGSIENIMFVVGATQAQELENIRKIVPDHFLLVPGVGAQGGSLADVARYGMNAQCGLLVNSSRAIIYADDGPDFAKAAGEKAREMRDEMVELLRQYE